MGAQLMLQELDFFLNEKSDSVEIFNRKFIGRVSYSEIHCFIKKKMGLKGEPAKKMFRVLSNALQEMNYFVHM